MSIILSIVIPVYNTERYISFCLDSLLVHQSLDKSSYEVIVVNDGSVDKSLDIVREYEAEYPNVIVLDQENEGISQNHILKILKPEN